MNMFCFLTLWAQWSDVIAVLSLLLLLLLLIVKAKLGWQHTIAAHIHACINLKHGRWRAYFHRLPLCLPSRIHACINLKHGHWRAYFHRLPPCLPSRIHACINLKHGRWCAYFHRPATMPPFSHTRVYQFEAWALACVLSSPATMPPFSHTRVYQFEAWALACVLSSPCHHASLLAYTRVSIWSMGVGVRTFIALPPCLPSRIHACINLKHGRWRAYFHRPATMPPFSHTRVYQFEAWALACVLSLPATMPPFSHTRVYQFEAWALACVLSSPCHHASLLAYTRVSIWSMGVGVRTFIALPLCLPLIPKHGSVFNSP